MSSTYSNHVNCFKCLVLVFVVLVRLLRFYMNCQFWLRTTPPVTQTPPGDIKDASRKATPVGTAHPWVALRRLAWPRVGFPKVFIPLFGQGVGLQGCNMLQPHKGKMCARLRGETRSRRAQRLGLSQECPKSCRQSMLDAAVSVRNPSVC